MKMKVVVLFCVLLATQFAWANELKSVNFYQQGEISKLVFDFDSPADIEKIHNKQDKQLLLDMPNVKGNPRVLKGIDVSEFPGSCIFISGYYKPGKANDLRFALQLRDNVQSSIEKLGNKIIVSIENRFGAFDAPIKSQNIVTKEKIKSSSKSKPKSYNTIDILENVTLSGQKQYVGKKISVNVSSMRPSELLKIIADASGFNIVIDEKEVDAKNPISLKLVDMPWDQVLDTVMGLSGLVAKRMDSILTVTSMEKFEAEQAAKVKRESETKKLEPLLTKIFPISYAKIEDLEKIITTYLTKDRGNLKIDKRTNYMIVYDTAETIEVIGRIVKELDSETPQVMIEGKVVELTEGNEKDLGLQNGLGINYAFAGRPATQGTGSFGLNTVSGSSGLLSVLITNVSRLINLDFKLNLMEKQDKAKIITSPKVITKHKEKANLVSATTQYVATPNASSTGLITNTLTPISANVSLDVTPQVTNENSINLEINIEKSDFTNLVGQQTSTQSNKIQTNVLVDNGNTLMIGGLYKTNESESQSGVPILKDIPLIGWLFKTSYKPIKKKSELIIFITPTIMNTKGNTSRSLSSESL